MSEIIRKHFIKAGILTVSLFAMSQSSAIASPETRTVNPAHTPTSTAVTKPAIQQSSAIYTTSQEAVPGIAPPGSADTAVYLDSNGQEIPMATESNKPAGPRQIGCTPESVPDSPHPSGGDVSGHGFWRQGDCTGTQADVYNCLYEYYTDNTWRQKACSPTERLYPGGGRGNRSTARAACESNVGTSWRNHVDVDVVDEIDTGENPYRQADVPCRVFS